MDKAGYIEAIQNKSAAFLKTVSAHTAPPLPRIPSCPDWNMLDLVVHLGGVHRMWTYVVSNKLQENPLAQREKFGIIMQPPASVLSWFGQSAPETQPLTADVLEWFQQGASKLIEVLDAADPETPVWTWADVQNVGHWQRAMAIETTVHCWDAQNAVGRPDSIEPELAKAGIDFMFDASIPYRRKRSQAPNGNGETFHFHCIDIAGEWLVQFEPSGMIIKREHGKGDLALRGTAENLLLFLYQRVPADNLEVFGDKALLDRYFELAPPS